MAASTVNIAEFRCPPLKLRAAPSPAPSGQENPHLKIVANPEPGQPQPSPASESANPPGVFDIETARNRHTMRQPDLHRPLPFRRHANLVRLDEPHVTVLRVQPRAQQMATCTVDDRDLPPAA
jgi:hypothetical protein